MKSNADNAQKSLKIKEALTVVDHNTKLGVASGKDAPKVADPRGKSKGFGKKEWAGASNQSPSSSSKNMTWTDPRSTRTEKATKKGKSKGSKNKGKKDLEK